MQATRLSLPLFLLLSLLSLVSLPVFASGPSIRFEHLSIEDGLPQNSGYSMLQDSKGFIWVGTKDGLARFDGYTVKVFKNNANDPDSLSANFIWAITEDSQGYLWIGTNGGGLNRFDSKTEQFTHYRYDASDPNSLSHDTVLAIIEDSQGDFWIGTEGGGLNHFNPKSEQFSHYRYDPDNPNSLSNDDVMAIVEDQQGYLWLATWGGGLNRFNSNTNEFKHFRFDPDNPDSLSNDRLLVLTKDKHGYLWIGTNGGGLNHFDPQSEKFISYRFDAFDVNSLSSDTVYTITEDQQGTLWVGTWDGGLNHFNPKNEQFNHYRFDATNPKGLRSDTILSSIVDFQGNIWVGTDGSGINRFNPENEKFNHYRFDVNDPKSLSHDDVRAIIEDKQGNLWIGSWGGIDLFNPKTEEFNQYRFDPDDPNSLSHNVVYAISEDKQGTLWVGTLNGGLNRFNSQTGQFKHYRFDPNNPKSLSNDGIRAITEDSHGFLWIGTWGGLDRFNPETEEFTHYRFDPADPQSLSHDMVLAITQDSRGIIWVGTWSGGLNYFDPVTEKFAHYRFDPLDSSSLSNDMVSAITEDSQGNLWIGTADGLNQLNRQTGQFRRWILKDGLPNNFISNIVQDKLGQLWITSNHGLSKFNPETQSFKNFDVGDGLQSNEFSVGASFLSQSGELFFGGINGFNRFYPDKITDDEQPPIIVFTDMLLLNQSVPIAKTRVSSEESLEVKSESNNDTSNNQQTLAGKTYFALEQAIQFTSSITLTHLENLVSFEFAALHFTNPKKNQYAYQLEGWDNHWIKTDFKNRRATYTNLPSGDYVLRVKASNHDGVWNEQGVLLNIRVLPPPWKSWWAYTIYAFLLASLVITFIRVQRKKVLHEQAVNRQLKQVDKLKDEFLDNTSHELLTPLNAIIGLSDIILIEGPQNYPAEELSDHIKIIRESGKQLLVLVSDILDFSAINDNKLRIDLQPTNLSEIIDNLILEVNLLKSNPLIDVSADIASGLALIKADQQRVYQILRNLLDNSLKFTLQGSIRVSAEQQANFVLIVVTDTGVGIPENRINSIFNRFEQVDGSSKRKFGGTGLGLTMVKELVELQGGKIRVSSSEIDGTRFEISLPIWQD